MLFWVFFMALGIEYYYSEGKVVGWGSRTCEGVYTDGIQAAVLAPGLSCTSLSLSAVCVCCPVLSLSHLQRAVSVCVGVTQ